MGRSRSYKFVDVEVEIELDDVLDFIENAASDKDLIRLRKALNHEEPSSSGIEGSLHEEMKRELLELACNRFTLSELERRLGTKFELI